MDKTLDLDKTLDFYDRNAKDYFNKTIKTNMDDKYEKFLSYLSKGSHILDLGCGSGRDSRYFLDNGYKVTAIDGSKNLSELATEYIGQKVYNMDFLNINSISVYDGVWACASLLHLTLHDIEEVLNKINVSLKGEGILYLSLKIGVDSTVYEDGRRFTYVTERTILNLIEKSNFYISQKWVSDDLLNRNIKWINIILNKNNK